MASFITLLCLVLGAEGLTDKVRPPYESMDPGISHVEAAGRWEHAGQTGLYRAVTYKRCSPEHCYDTLFIEWLTREAKPRVVTIKQVVEVGDLTVMSEVRFLQSNGGTRLQVQHEIGAGEDHWIKCLTLGPPGKYAVQDQGRGAAA